MKKQGGGQQGKGKTNAELSVACFNLQQVLNCSNGEVSNFYYRRELSAYNLSIYILNTKDASCFK